MLSISHFIFSCFPQWDTPKRNHSCVSIEDAGRVEDPTSLVRPCKTIVDGRSLVTVSQRTMCIEDELQLVNLYCEPLARKSISQYIPAICP